MKKMKNKKDSKREPLPGSPEARPEGGRSKADTAKDIAPQKDGAKSKAEGVADDDGMPPAKKNTDRRI